MDPMWPEAMEHKLQSEFFITIGHKRLGEMMHSHGDFGFQGFGASCLPSSSLLLKTNDFASSLCAKKCLCTMLMRKTKY